MTENKYPLRINKYLALKGFSTRRGADEMISQNLVFINNRQAKLGDQVTMTDKVSVKSKSENKNFKYYRYYKPRGLLTHANKKTDKDIIKNLPLKNVFPLGRLDKDSEGLIILTNDGRLTDRLLNPVHIHEKEYQVKVDKELKPAFAQKISKGVKIEDYLTKPSKAEILNLKEFKLIITEGKKHQIRRMCAALGYSVESLIRIRILNLTLGNLKPGEYQKIPEKDLKKFLNILSLPHIR